MTLSRPIVSPLYRVPVLGWIARDIEQDQANIWYLLVAVLSLLMMAVMTWGLQVMALAALCAVPVMFIILIRITLG